MKAVIWTEYGPPNKLIIGEVDKPVPKDDEILIQVITTTVSLGDCEIRALALTFAFKLLVRLYLGFRKPRGFTLGQEFAGIVIKAGKDVNRFSEGDEVFGQTGMNMGAYAQFMTLKKDALIAKKPSNITFEEAACLPLGGMEAYYYIKESNLHANSKVLIIGAGGSIGTMAIQLLKLLRC